MEETTAREIVARFLGETAAAIFTIATEHKASIEGTMDWFIVGPLEDATELLVGVYNPIEN